MGVCTKNNQKIDPRIITSYYSKPEGCQKARYHDIPADFLDIEDELRDILWPKELYGQAIAPAYLLLGQEIPCNSISI